MNTPRCKQNQLLTTAVLLLFSTFGFAQQEAYESPAGTKFLLYTPPGYYSSSSTVPLLLSLHSKGEVGDDLTELTSKNPEQMPSRLIYLNRWPQDLPFIVLTPQLTAEKGDPDPVWGPQWPAEYIDEVVRYVTANFRVDVQRIYVTGISKGGIGTWTYASAHPEKVAAVIPISGRSDVTKACAVKDIPTWVFHGDGDQTVIPQYSIDMVNAIMACQPSGKYKPRLTILNARGHNGWNEVYNGSSGYKIYEWLLKFRKNDSSNKPPYVNAGPDYRIKNRTEPFHLIGDFFDSESDLLNIAWTQTSGMALTLQDTQSKYLKLTNLKPGSFEFELAVTDNNGAVARDRVMLEIVTDEALPAVTGLTLINGKTNEDIGKLTEGLIIDKQQLGITEINIRAAATADAASIRFSVNTDQNTRTLNSSATFYITPQSSFSEWKIQNGDYLICATPYTKAYTGGLRGVSECVKVKVIDGVAGCSGAGKIQRELWTGISGTNVSSIPVDSPPSSVTDLSIFETPANIGDNYGSRVRGYICVPTTGNYTFWIASDDKSELWLSTDESPANKARIASVGGWSNPRQWDKYATQKSAVVSLVAGRRYYIEALLKEGTGGDHLAVGWQLPGGALERPISGNRLIQFQSSATTGTVDVETWTGISGKDISSIPVASPPNSVSEIMIFETAKNIGDNYGSRVRAQINVPTTGNYTFWIASDDTGELWLSTDENPANKVKVAYVTGWTYPRQWDKYTTQRSAPVNLVGGRKYYIEALLKEGTGGDHLAVGWQLPEGALERPVPGSRLSKFEMNSAAIAARQTETGQDQTLFSQIDIYPNPAEHGDAQLRVGYEAIAETADTQVEIINMTGEVVFTETRHCAGNCHSYLININQQLVPGVYLVHLKINGARYSKRLLVK